MINNTNFLSNDNKAIVWQILADNNAFNGIHDNYLPKIKEYYETTIPTNKASGKAKLKSGDALTDAEISALFGD